MSGNFEQYLLIGETHRSFSNSNGNGAMFGASGGNFNASAPIMTTTQRAMEYLHHNRFIQSIKDIVNGFISPVRNFDLYSSDLHRNKFGNSRVPIVRKEVHSPVSNPKQESLQTAVLELRLGTCGNPGQSPAFELGKTDLNKNMDAVIAVDSSEEFPDLSPPAMGKSSRKGKPKQACISNSPARPNANENCIDKLLDCDTDDGFEIFRNRNLSSRSIDPDRTRNCVKTCNFFKRRQLSESSEDSFVICFSDDAPAGVIEMVEEDESDATSGSDTEEETQSDSEIDSEDEIECDEDCTTKIPKKTETCFLTSLLSSQPDSGFSEEKPRKKVRFNLKPKVHLMFAWQFAYRASRKGQWEALARDRDRFRRRIDGVKCILNPVLNPKHRERIYQTRFCDNSSMGQSVPLD